MRPPPPPLPSLCPPRSPSPSPPPTPASCFSTAPTVVAADDQFDKAVEASPRTPPSSPTADPCFLFEEVCLRNRRRWEQYDQLESSPPCRRIPPVSQEGAGDAFSCAATHAALVDPDELVDLSRYSVLIHEVSLLVGLAADDDRLSPGGGRPLTPDEARQVPDILPLRLTPTKSLSSRKHGSARLPCPTNTKVQVHLSSGPINPRADNANPSVRNEKLPLAELRGLVTPIARHKSADPVRPRISPQRRQGQVFHFEPSFSNASAVDLDETFSHPRQPPPTPTPNPPVNRCSSLDRLECSMRKLEAHAPGIHRKSQSEGLAPDRATQWKDKRPSLPPPRRLKKQQSTHEIMRRNLSRPAADCHFSGPPPVPRPMPRLQYVVPQTCPAMASDNELREGNHTPGSFMDMDIPPTEEAPQERNGPFRQVTTKEKMKSLVNAARRVSRGVIAWGKNWTGSTKPSAV